MANGQKNLVANKDVANKDKAIPLAKRGNVTNLRPAGKQKPAPVPADTRWRMPAVRWVAQAMLLKPADANARRRRAFLFRLGVFVVLPTLLMTGYVYLYATPRYVSELQITYQSNNTTSSSASSGILTSIMGSAGGTDMSSVLQTYLTSQAVAEIVDKETQFRKHYSSSNIDWLDRLSPTASAEKYLIYFNKRITVSRQFGGYVTVDVEAFDPQFSQTVAQSLTKAADKMVAVMMDNAHNDAVVIAEAELRRTEDRLRKAMVDLTNFRNRHSDVNIQGTANSLDTVVSGLETQLSTATSDLSDAKAFLSTNAPSVVALNARINSLRQQIDTEKKRLGYTDPGTKLANGKLPYSQIVADFTALQTEQTFASNSYVSAKSALDAARAMALQKSGYVVTFVPPSLPQASTSPDPTTYILTTFLVSLFSYMIGVLMIGVFQDRSGG